jgi:hypothetical protein
MNQNNTANANTAVSFPGILHAVLRKELFLQGKSKISCSPPRLFIDSRRALREKKNSLKGKKIGDSFPL